MEGNLAPAAANMADINQNQTVNVHKKNKRFSLFKAEMVMIQNPRNEKKKPVKVANIYSDDKWKKLVGSMRPLHLQDSQSPPPQNPAAIKIPTGKRSEMDELFPIPPSSTSSWGTMSQFASTDNLQELAGTGTMSQNSSASNLQELAGGASTMSQYGSATNLHDLDVEEEHENDKVLENCESDVMIDAKMDELFPISPSSTSSWGTMSQFASTDNLQELAGTGTMSQNSSASNLQELAGGASTMSQYGSATNLHDLDVEEEDENDKVLENCESDVMIDAKVEEFIAQFYEQMRRQHKGKPRP